MPRSNYSGPNVHHMDEGDDDYTLIHITGKGHDCRREFRYLRNLYDGGILDNIHLAEHDLITYVFYKYHYLGDLSRHDGTEAQH